MLQVACFTEELELFLYETVYLIFVLHPCFKIISQKLINCLTRYVCIEEETKKLVFETIQCKKVYQFPPRLMVLQAEVESWPLPSCLSTSLFIGS